MNTSRNWPGMRPRAVSWFPVMLFRSALILRSGRSPRLEGWAAIEFVAILRDARKSALLKDEVETNFCVQTHQCATPRYASMTF